MSAVAVRSGDWALSAAIFAIALAAASAWAWIVVPHAQMPASVALAALLLALIGHDLREHRLPNPLTLAMGLAGLAVAWTNGRPLLLHLAGAGVGYALLALTAWLYARKTGREGLGLGDAKLLAAGGAWLGAEALPTLLLLSAAGGFAWYGAFAALRGRDALRQAMPFGVPLAAAIWLGWLYGSLGFG